MAVTSLGLKTHIWNNNLRSMVLIALYPILIIGIVWLIGALGGYLFSDYIEGTAADPMIGIRTGNDVVISYWPIIFSIVGIWFLISFFFHTRMIRMLSKAHPVSRQEEPELYNLLENLCIARGLPLRCRSTSTSEHSR